jgi:hypothetical protein
MGWKGIAVILSSALYFKQKYIFSPPFSLSSGSQSS